MMKTIILALALAAGANADCTIINPTTLTGIEAGDANGCSGTAITSAGETATCSLKCTAGYTCTGTTIHTCTGTTLTAATLATTGCAQDFKQSTNALKTPSTAATASPAADVVGTCVACAGTTGVEATVFGATAPTCGECTIHDVATLVGITGAASNGCTNGQVKLKAGSTCGVALDTGYTGTTGTTVHSCAGSTTAAGTLTEATLATTGCAANWRQSTDALKTPDAANAATNGVAAGTCVACGGDDTLIATAFADTAPTCAAGCTGLIDPTTLVGIEADTAGPNGPCVGTVLALNSKCDLKISAGYTGSGITFNECKAAAGTEVKATLATTGCAANWKQSTDALKIPDAANAATNGNAAGTCVQCGNGLTSAAAVFADTAPTCSACPADTMGTAGTCAQGCPADSYQSAGLTAADIECTACDPTKFKLEASQSGIQGSIEGDAATLAGTGCAAAGCRVDYYQTAGTPYVAAVVAVTAANAQGANVATCTETAKDVAATCVPTADIYTAQCTGLDLSSKTACEAVTTFKADGTADTAKACTYTAAVTNQVGTDATNCGNAATNDDGVACAAVKKSTAGSTTESACTFTAAKAVAEAALIEEVPVTCSKCPIGKVNSATQDGAVKAGSEGTCTWCNPYIAGKCTSGCPADYYQKTGTTSATIKCLGCPAGKVLSNAGVLSTVQTEAACTTPAAAASGAFRSVANAAATAVAASFAAAALM